MVKDGFDSPGAEAVCEYVCIYVCAPPLLGREGNQMESPPEIAIDDGGSGEGGSVEWVTCTAFNIEVVR